MTAGAGDPALCGLVRRRGEDRGLTGARHGPFGQNGFVGSTGGTGEFDARPVRAFRPGPDVQVDENGWPASGPAMAQLLREGLELPAGLTVLVGENGSGLF